jgi:heterogeneous nuclear ribonucleoprotein A1/A3
VEIKKAEPKKSSKPPQSAYGRNSRPAYDSDPLMDYPSADTYSRIVDCPTFTAITAVVDFILIEVMEFLVVGSACMYDRMDGCGGGYGRYYAGLEGYGGRPSFGYPSHFGLYGGGHRMEVK